MAKRKAKRTIKNEAKTKAKRNSRRKTNQNNSSKVSKKSNNQKRKRKSYTISYKLKDSISLSSFDFSEHNKIKVLLPDELLDIAKNILRNKISLPTLRKAIKIYDINDDINYEYLNLLKRLTKMHYKYIYTLSFHKRQAIIKKHKIDREIFTKSSKIIFQELVDFLINKYKPDDSSSKKELATYNLEGFEKFIIPISEGTVELKYYYFINIILEWIKGRKKNINIYLRYFRNFFQNKNNLNKIEHVFFVIFRIDLLIIDPKSEGQSSLAKVNLMVNEDLIHKIDCLKYIQSQIEENLNDIIINNNTELTLKENSGKFRPNDYYFSGDIKDVEPSFVVDSIIKKEYMTYDYYIKNKLNFFDDEIKAKAFLNYFRLILPSKVMNEYYEKVKSFKNFEFPLTNEKVVDYLLGKIICTVFNKNYWGMTNIEGFGIFINKRKYEKSVGLNYGGCLITVSHEVMAHLLRILINSNIGIKASTETPNQSFINDKDNEDTRLLGDGGEKFETLLFGKTNPTLTIGGNHFLFDIKNWNLSLEKFKKGFEDNNIVKSVKTLKSELEALKKKKYVGELFKDINYKNVTSEADSQSIPTRKDIMKHYQDSEFA